MARNGMRTICGSGAKMATRDDREAAWCPRQLTIAPRHGAGAREVIVVAAVVLVLLILILPYLANQRELQRRNICEARQFRLSLALIQYSLDHQALPGYRNLQAETAAGEPRPTSWIFPALPYVHPIDVDISSTLSPDYTGGPIDDAWNFNPDEKALIGKTGPFAELHGAYGPEGTENQRGQIPVSYIPELVCPSDVIAMQEQRLSPTSFVANCGMPDATATEQIPADWLANGVFTNRMPGQPRMSPPTTLEYLEDHDGLNNIVMLAENVDAGQWTDSTEASIGIVWRPAEIPKEITLPEILGLNQSVGKATGTISAARPSSGHVRGFNIAFASGATKFITDDIDPRAWYWMMMSDSTAPRYPGTEVDVDPPIRR